MKKQNVMSRLAHTTFEDRIYPKIQANNSCCDYPEKMIAFNYTDNNSQKCISGYFQSFIKRHEEIYSLHI